jgi:hypothetical protein
VTARAGFRIIGKKRLLIHRNRPGDVESPSGDPPDQKGARAHFQDAPPGAAR